MNIDSILVTASVERVYSVARYHVIIYERKNGNGMHTIYSDLKEPILTVHSKFTRDSRDLNRNSTTFAVNQ